MSLFLSPSEMFIVMGFGRATPRHPQRTVKEILLWHFKRQDVTPTGNESPACVLTVFHALIRYKL
jgi:hypothetical protein